MNGPVPSLEPVSPSTIPEAARFVAERQRREESSVAWLGTGIAEIDRQLRSLPPLPASGGHTGAPADAGFPCLALRESGRISGMLGMRWFSDQALARLLGPYAEGDDAAWEERSNGLWTGLQARVPPECRKLRVAFPAGNRRCRSFYAERGFRQYGAERTLSLTRSRALAGRVGRFDEGNPVQREPGFRIAPYDSAHRAALDSLHPPGAYFTADQIAAAAERTGPAALLMGFVRGRAVGYVYTETFPAERFGEICFVNVEPASRGMGCGRALVEAGIRGLIADDRIRRVDISVRVDNEGAERLYRRIGFRERILMLAWELELPG